MSLLTDDQCRVCFHGPHPGSPCVDIAHDPGPPDADGTVPDIATVCGCTEYVDLETESRIVVRTGRDPRNPIFPVSIDPSIRDPESGLLRAHRPDSEPSTHIEYPYEREWCRRCGKGIHPNWFNSLDTTDPLHNPANYPPEEHE